MGNIITTVKRMVWEKGKQYIPKKLLVERYHYQKLGRKPDFKNPQRFTDKMGWYKLYYRDERMRTCSDKASVRDYIESQGFGYLLNECYGVYDRVEDINWDALPQQFVLKDTLGGSGKSVLLVFDKATLDIEATKETLQSWLDKSANRVSPAGEWVYEGRKARIIAEKLLVADANGDLPDYKFFCFNGKVFCSYHMRNCTTKGRRTDGEFAALDREYNLLPVYGTTFKTITEQPEKPKNYEQMVEIAEKLSAPFPHVRVDFYNIDGRIIFGELTFFTKSGVSVFNPDSFDFEMGKQFVLPKRNH